MHSFIGAFAKLRKASISFVMSVHPSVRMKQLGSHWTDFHEILYLSISRSSVEKIQVSLESKKNTEDRYAFFIMSRWIILRMRNILDESRRENRNTFYVQIHLFRKSWGLGDNVKNVVWANKPQVTI
jgi:hypothetical protein